MLSSHDLFDAHFHVIDPRFPLVSSHGFLPGVFTCDDYLDRLKDYRLRGGAVVSGSFQSFDQSYLLDALHRLGPSFVGVTSLPASVPDNQIMDLDRAGVRAVRFNLRRGGTETVKHLESMAWRVHELAGWHIELYSDADDLSELYQLLLSLPAVSIDHIGLTKSGFATVVKLAEQGIRVKATGFGRVDFNVRTALKRLHSANPESLMFGTDLPSTRVERAYNDDDFRLLIDTLGEQEAARVLYDNAIAFYKPRSTG
ncbi:MAG TPA: amidohydrolase family protein [Gammaproteobacteria bacterium]|nr:amidohydrolase family protein [Gammaproteobacteria bacterium]